jgi:hypothetical protein
VATCKIVEVERRFRCAYCLHHQGHESGHLHTCLRENRTSQKTTFSSQSKPRNGLRWTVSKEEKEIVGTRLPRALSIDLSNYKI